MKSVKNHRIITDLFPHCRKPVALGLIFGMFSLTVILSYLCMDAWGVYQMKEASIEQTNSKLTYWESVVRRYPHFPKAYYEVAVYAYQLGQPEKAQEFLNQALQIDPNFFEAEVFAKEIEEK